MVKLKKPEENKSILEQAGDKFEEIVDDVKDLVNSSESEILEKSDEDKYFHDNVDKDHDASVKSH